MTKPMTEWDRSRIWTEADRLNRTPEAFCELQSQEKLDHDAYQQLRGEINGTPKVAEPWPSAFIVLLCAAAPVFGVVMWLVVTSWVPALVQAIGWSG